MMTGPLPALIGTHVSIAGGIDKAIARGVEIGCSAIQVFTRNASRWQSKPLSVETIAAFRDARQVHSLTYVAAHASYLINLASPDKALRQKSIDAFIDEMERCSLLGIEDLVMHPGAHVGQGAAAGLDTLVDSFEHIFAQAPKDVRILVENTAGQGTYLGASFKELAEILQRLPQAKLAICFDTCHAFAAGYDLTSAAGYADVMTEFERQVGIDRLALFHLNDSKKALGSRVDRHDHLGRGLIGLGGFGALMQDTRFGRVAKIIETPPGDNHCEDLVNLALLRKMAAAPAGAR